MTPQEALARVIEHREIFHEEMLDVMRQIMQGEVSPVMIAAIVVGLRVKKETIGEIAAAAQVMRDFSTKVPVADKAALVDTCGTGGDSAHTFNISTAAAFVAAAAGAFLGVLLAERVARWRSCCSWRWSLPVCRFCPGDVAGSGSSQGRPWDSWWASPSPPSSQAG